MRTAGARPTATANPCRRPRCPYVSLHSASRLEVIMRVPLSWLKDYVPLPANPAELVERLTLAGLEAGDVQAFGVPVPEGLRVKPEDAGVVWDRDKVMTARVIEITKHPDADKLKLVKLDYGAAEPKTVVTGATNIAPGQGGMKVVLGLRGTRYYYTDKD